MELYIQIFITTLAISFSILHLIIYIYNRGLRSNLFFALFLFSFSLNTFLDYQGLLTSNYEIQLIYLRLHRIIFPFPLIFSLLFIYAVFNYKIPKHFWFLSLSFIIITIPAMIVPNRYFSIAQLFQIVLVVEAVRIFIDGFRNDRDGALLVTIAFSLLILTSTYDTILDINLIEPILNIRNGYPLGFGLLVLLMSIYLAREFARVSRNILIKEQEKRELELAQRLLSEEDKRKSKELNDARELQLSLLPTCDTHIGNYEICFDMKTAAEVGGDYYDYILNDKGELTLVIGDATDHGMRAGMMVSIVKSLFLSHGDKLPIDSFLNDSSRTVKQMKLHNLFMALMVVQLKKEVLTVSSAGIPPLLLYRKRTNKIEEYKTKGMPLGAVNSFPYEVLDIELEVGDTVLLMTDGLSELFNNEKNVFGEERIKELFLNHSQEPTSKIVSELFSEAEKWRGSTAQNDDITFVAFRLVKDF